jgi:hypothetical protein
VQMFSYPLIFQRDNDLLMLLSVFQ